ncbi:hypothetical protein ABPG75_004715 [Micractinium tetrahymenae]
MPATSVRHSPGSTPGRTGRPECRGRTLEAPLSVCTLSFDVPPPAERGRAGSGTASASSSPRSPLARRPRPTGGRPGGRPATPPPIAGRQHGDCQTEAAVLEALALPPEGATGTQTDAEPAVQPARPQRPPPGEDASTQVSPQELFDFDRDAAPAVRGLVAAALQAAELEAAEALRLEALRRRRLELEEEQYREAAALLKLEQDAARRAALRAAQQREAEALAALRAAQQRTPVAFEMVSEEDLEREVLAVVLPTLESMAAEELRAAYAGTGGAAEGVTAAG